MCIICNIMHVQRRMYFLNYIECKVIWHGIALARYPTLISFLSSILKVLGVPAKMHM